MIFFVLLAMVYYLLVGKIIFHFTLSRKSIQDRIMKKQFAKMIEQHKIDLCWWKTVKFKELSIKSFDGLSLVGHYVDRNSTKTAVVVHGFGGDYRETQPYCKLFYDKNFNVLTIVNRAHGKSEGSCIGLGWLERKDLLGWIDYLVKINPQNNIVLFGISMGATAVCSLAGEKLLPNVVGLISDCAFANADRQISSMIKKIKLGKTVLKKHLYSYVNRFYDFDIIQVDAMSQVKKTKIPILYIHAEKDALVPVDNVYSLYEATPQNLREKFVVEGSGHCLCYATAGVEYEKRISDFLRKRTIIK